jgi:hypothetical protein
MRNIIKILLVVMMFLTGFTMMRPDFWGTFTIISDDRSDTLDMDWTDSSMTFTIQGVRYFIVDVDTVYHTGVTKTDSLLIGDSLVTLMYQGVIPDTTYLSNSIDNFVELHPDNYTFLLGDGNTFIPAGSNTNDASSILGGKNNTISVYSTMPSLYSVIGAGEDNLIEGADYSMIGAGSDNELERADYASIPSGQGLYLDDNDHCMATGKYNSSGTSSSDGTLFVIGNGTGDGSRSDAFVVDDDGDVSINGSLVFDTTDVGTKSDTFTIDLSKQVNYVTIDDTVAINYSNAQSTTYLFVIEIDGDDAKINWGTGWQSALGTISLTETDGTKILISAFYDIRNSKMIITEVDDVKDL